VHRGYWEELADGWKSSDAAELTVIEIHFFIEVLDMLCGVCRMLLICQKQTEVWMSASINRLEIEEIVRNAFNISNRTSATKQRLTLPGGTAQHEFDIFQESILIGGISTSPWRNLSGTNNTGGQDRVSTELFWLSLWGGRERRVLLLTDEAMAQNLYRRFRGAPVNSPIEIYHCNLQAVSFNLVGTLVSASTI